MSQVPICPYCKKAMVSESPYSCQCLKDASLNEQLKASLELEKEKRQPKPFHFVTTCAECHKDFDQLIVNNQHQHYVVCPSCRNKDQQDSLGRLEQELKHREFKDGVVRDNNRNKGRFDLIPTTALELLAKHYQKGAELYGENNWLQGEGLPSWTLIDSGMRHLVKAHRGDNDEDHLVAAAWNIMSAIELRERRKKNSK